MTAEASHGIALNNGFVRVRPMAARNLAKPTPAPQKSVVRNVAREADGAALLKQISEKRHATQTASQHGAHARRGEGLEFRLIFMMAFVVFLLTAAFERVVPMKSRAEGASAGEARKSVLQEAREAASISAAYAFMG